MIKLVKSGRTLTKTKRYYALQQWVLTLNTHQRDVDDLGAIEGGIHRLLMTRGDAQKVARVKFTPRKQLR